jgi:hypothetical protein
VFPLLPQGVSGGLSPYTNNKKKKKKKKKKALLIFLCTEAWAQYFMNDQEKWPSEGSLNYNTILQLDFFCKRVEK